MYYHIEHMFVMIGEANGKDALEDIYDGHYDAFMDSQGSSHNHQAWPGGYLDHVTEVMNIAVKLYETMNSLRPLAFTLSQALTVLFLHDIEKPFKIKGFSMTKQERKEFRHRFVEDNKIKLTEEMKNALDYCEGEGDDYTNKERVMGPLAAFCHMCDIASARIWFDQPYTHRKRDEWL